MKLTYEIIKAELAERLECEVFGNKHGNVSLESPQLYENGIRVSDDHCYVAASMPAIAMKENTRALFIICGLVPESLKEKQEGNLMFFSSSQSLLDVMNLLLNIFDKYRKWTEDLYESLLESGSINALLKRSIPIFQNPLFLIDSRFYLVAEASFENAEDFDLPMKKVDDTWIVLGKDELQSAGKLNAPFFRHFPDDYPRLFINLTEDNYLLGNLSIQASNCPLRACDEYLLTHLAKVIHKALLRLASPDNNRVTHVESMLSDIIAGGIVDSENFNKTMSYFGYTRDDQFRCLAIRIPSPSGKEFIRNFLQLIGTQLPAIYIPTSGEIAAMVMSVSSASEQSEKAVLLMEEKMSSLGFRVGLSDTYYDLLLTKQYFAQAKYALDHSETSQKSMTLFSDFCLDYILENAHGELKPDMLWNEGFRRLVKHDEKGRANYVETLRAYLNNNLNAHRAAAALYITRSSLISQLERIYALLGEDLTNPKVRFRYELSLLLYDKYRS